MHDWERLIEERLPNLSEDPAEDASIREELAQHLEDRYQSSLSTGLSESDAYCRVCEELGSAERARYQIRNLDRGRLSAVPPAMKRRWFSGLFADVAYAARLMRSNPTLSLFALLVVAIGISSTTTIFSVVNGVLLRPLPYPSGNDIVVLGHPTNSGRPGNLGFATLADWRASARSFEQMSAIRSWSPTLEDDRGAERVAAMRVSSNYFDVLGVVPARGRSFRPEEDSPDTRRVAMLSHPLWRDRFGSDPGIIGRSIRLSDGDYEVVGIMPEEFEDLLGGHLYHAPRMWAPIGYDDTLSWACRGCQHIKGVGRLRPGTELAAARAELQAIQSGLRIEHVNEYSEDAGAAIERFGSELTAAVRPALQLLSVAVLFVLLIACANVANMFLARSIERRKEMSLRVAIGAERGRLVRLLLCESLLLASLGGALGLLASPWLVRGLLVMAPTSVRGLGPIGVDLPAIVFAVAATVGTGILFGLAPALTSGGADIASALRQDGRATADNRVRRAQRLLVVADLMLALVLLCGSLTMIQSVRNLLRVDPGFESDRLLIARINLLGNRYEDEASVKASLEQIIEKVGALPGVQAVAAASQMPLTGDRDAWGVHRRDRPQTNPAEAPYALLFRVTPGYFASMGLRLVAGRLLSDSDREGAPNVIVVSESMAESLWRGENPIGAEVKIGGGDEQPWYTVVGICNDVHSRSSDASPELQMYVPIHQNLSRYLTLAIRVNDASVAGSIRETVAAVAPGVPVFAVAEMQHFIDELTADRRFVSLLLGYFALTAIVLTGAGVYGLASYFVLQRRRELGVRAALGADRFQIARVVLDNGLRLAVPGLVGGWILIAASRQLLDHLAFGVDSLEVTILLTSSFMLLGILLLSHLVPVLRAARIDPVLALRGE